MSNFRRSLIGGGEQPVFVDWIRLDKAYIDTDIPLNTDDLLFDCILGWEEQNCVFLGAQRMTTTPVKRFVLYNYANKIHQFVYNSSVYGFDGTETNVSHRYRLLSVNNKLQYIVDTVNVSNFDKFEYHYGKTLLLGAIYKDDNGADFNIPTLSDRPVIIKYADFTTSNRIYNFRPCYYSGQYGLWDINTDTFHAKSGGTGTIIGGYD